MYTRQEHKKKHLKIQKLKKMKSQFKAQKPLLMSV